MDRLTITEQADNGTVARWLESQLDAVLAATHDPVSICIPGGSTPFPILEELTASQIDWRRIHVWPGDDRIVPEDHPASNVGKIKALLEPAGATIVALCEDIKPPHFSIVWLGMGADGHIASLFPGNDPQADDTHKVRRLTPDPLPPEAPFDRLTLTIPALLDSDQIIFVIRGEEKRAIFGDAAAGRNDLPVARLLNAAEQPVQCFT